MESDKTSLNQNLNRMTKNTFSYLLEFVFYCDIPNLMNVSTFFRKTIKSFVKDKVFWINLDEYKQKHI